MNFNFKTLALAAIAFAFTACEQANTCNYDETAKTLSCPEKVYKTVSLAGKVWMAENMADYVPDNSICYGNDHANCEAMGRLYTWGAANNGLCPNGWTVPSQQDFKDVFGSATVEDLKKADGFKMVLAGFRYFDGK